MASDDEAGVNPSPCAHLFVTHWAEGVKDKLAPKEEAMKRIAGWMTFEEVLSLYPEAAAVFARYGLACLGCLGAAFDSLERGAKVHGVDLQTLLQDLNGVVEN